MKHLFKRPARVILCAAVAVFALLGTMSFAKAGNPALVPSKTAYVVSLPDVAAFWNAWKANAIYQAYKKTISSSDIAPKLETFNKQLRVIEAALGFPLNGETLSQIFKAGDIYLAPGNRAGEISVGVVLEVKDKDKLTRLLDLAEKAAAAAAQPETDSPDTDSENEKPANEKPANEASEDKSKSQGGAEDEDSTPSETASPSTSDSSTTSGATGETYKGVLVKRFAGNEDSEMLYAVIGNYLLGSNTESEIRALIDRMQAAGSPTGDTMAASAEYQKALTAIQSKPGEMYVFGNQKAAMEMQQSQAGMENLQTMIRRMAPIEYWAGSVKFAPKEVSFYSYGALPPGSDGQSLPEKFPGDKPLQAVNYVPANTLMVFATSLVDSKLFYDFVDELSNMMGAGKADQMSAIEGQLGFSVKEDLVPALGNEFAFALNSVKIAAEGPSVDGAIVLKIGDKARMDKVLAGLDKMMGQMGGAAASMSSETDDKKKDDKTAAATPQSGIKTSKVGDVTIKYVEIPMMTAFSPGYAVDGEYLLIATTQNAIKAMIELKKGGSSGIANSDVLKKLAPRVTTTANSFQFFNFKAIWDTVGALTDQIPAMQAADKIVDALRVLQAMGSSSSTKDGALVSEAVLVLQ